MARSTIIDSSTSSDSDSNPGNRSGDSRRKAAGVIPKINPFSGKKDEWRGFMFNFRQMAKQLQWSEREKKANLLMCLRGKAAEHVYNSKKSSYATYRDLGELLAERFDSVEQPMTARRQLMSLNQEIGESLEDFGDRVLAKATEGWKGNVDESSVQLLAKECFLRGCRDKNAALQASQWNPVTLSEAMKEVRMASANMEAFGRKNPPVATRGVSFKEDWTPDQGQFLEWVKDYIKHLDLKNGQKSPATDTPRATQESGAATPRAAESRNRSPPPSSPRRDSRSRSPSPRGTCWTCGSKDHWKGECPKKGTVCYNCQGEGHLSRDCPKPRPVKEASN